MSFTLSTNLVFGKVCKEIKSKVFYVSWRVSKIDKDGALGNVHRKCVSETSLSQTAGATKRVRVTGEVGNNIAKQLRLGAFQGKVCLDGRKSK